MWLSVNGRTRGSMGMDDYRDHRDDGDGGAACAATVLCVLAMIGMGSYLLLAWIDGGL